MGRDQRATAAGSPKPTEAVVEIRHDKRTGKTDVRYNCDAKLAQALLLRGATAILPKLQLTPEEVAAERERRSLIERPSANDQRAVEMSRILDRQIGGRN